METNTKTKEINTIEVAILADLLAAGAIWDYPFKAWQYEQCGHKKNFKTLKDLLGSLGSTRYDNGKILNRGKINVVVLYSDVDWAPSALACNVTSYLGPIIKKYKL